jgi:hypothetical protein
MGYPAVGNPCQSVATSTCTIRGRKRPIRTGVVQFMRAALLTLACTAGAVPAAEWPDLSRSQAGGWLELQRDQARRREQLRPGAMESSPEAAASLERLERQERQERLDRRALDRREAQWLDDARRRHRWSGGTGAARAPALRAQIERAERTQRLRRDLQRHTFGPRPGTANIPGPSSPFRLR